MNGPNKITPHPINLHLTPKSHHDRTNGTPFIIGAGNTEESAQELALERARKRALDRAQESSKTPNRCAALLEKTVLNPIARNIVYPALKNIGGGLVITGTFTSLLKESGPMAVWIGLGVFGATTLLTSALFYRTEYLGRHFAESIGDAVAGIPLYGIDFCQAYICPATIRDYNPRQTTLREISISEREESIPKREESISTGGVSISDDEVRLVPGFQRLESPQPEEESFE